MPDTFIALMGRVYRALRSPRLTAWVIGLLIVLYTLGLVLPQKWMFGSRADYDLWLAKSFLYQMMDYAGFTSIYRSPLTMALLALFFVNLVIVVANRVPVILRRAYIGATPDLMSGLVKDSANAVELSCPPQEALNTVRDMLSSRGFSTIAQGAGEGGGSAILAIRNRYSPLGFLFFHMSFLLCLLGGLMIFYTRFSGNITLTEGQTFGGEMSMFHRITSRPRVMEKLPALGLEVLGVKPVYENDIPSRLEATVSVLYGGRAVEEGMDVNHPVKRGPMTVLVNNIGVSPLFQVLGPSGQQMDAAYVSLNVLNDRLDSFRLSDESYEFVVRFYPDYEMADGLEISRSMELKNPAFHLQVRREGIVLYDGTIRPGEEAEFRHYRIKVLDIRYWVEFIVVREYGRGPLILGFVLGALGLIMRLVFYQKKFRVLVEGSSGGSIIYLEARSEYFPLSFAEEATALRESLRLKLNEEVPQ